MNEYDGRQFVGIDLHRRRTVIVRSPRPGSSWDGADRERPGGAGARDRQGRAGAGGGAGGHLRLVLGGGRAAEAGARVHLAHPLGIKGFAYRRVKNDVRDAADLADLLRMGRLPEAWIAPPAGAGAARAGAASGEAGRAALRVEEPGARGAGQAGLHVPMKELFGPAGRACSPRRRWDRVYRARVDSLLRLIDTLDSEIDLFAGWIAGRLRAAPGLPGDPADPRGRADVGRGVRRRDRRRQPVRTGRSSCARWAGLTPRHRESDTTVHRGPITKMGCGGRGGGFRSQGGRERGRSSCRSSVASISIEPS